MNAKAGKRGGLCGLDVEAVGGTEEVQNKIPSIPLANQH